MKETKHLRFTEDNRPALKAGTWIVRNKHDGQFLGKVMWYGAWRQHCYFPVSADLVFSTGCLRDIADFCAERTKEQAQRREQGAA